MADINYIHYGNEQIDQQALLNSLANNVQNYVASQPWSRRRKEKFMSAYSDILSKGVQGASNDTGQWMIDVGGNVDLDSISTKDKEMYLEAAYFIQQQMASLPILKKEEEKKEELPVLTNSQFQKDFGTFLTNQEFGGSKERLASGWKGLDTVRDAEGKLSTKVRRNTLANALQGYRDSLKDNQYNFEGSPFIDLNTFKTRLDDAIAAIRSDDPNDDNAAFNRLGLNAADWFDTGLNDDSGKVDSNGNPLTYGQLAQLQKTQTPSSNQTASVQKQNPLIFRTLKANFVGKTPQELKEQYGDQYSLIEALNKYSYGDIQQLNSDQKREIFGAMKMAKNNISDDLYNQLVHTPTYKGAAKNRFKVIEGVDNYIYDVKTGNIIQVQREELANQETDLFSGIETDEEKEQREMLEADSRKLSEDFRIEDTLRMAAIAQDMAAAVAAFVPTYGTATAGALGLSSLGTNMAADIMDESVTKGEVAKNALINLGLGAVGLVPGLGAVGKGAKWLTQIAKWTPRILTLANAGNIALNDDIKNSLAKVLKVSKISELTNHDLKNIAYALSVTAGLSREANAIRTNRKYGTGLKGKTTSSEQVETQSGKTYKVSKEKLGEINKALSKGDEESANKIFREAVPKAENEKLKINTRWGFNKYKPTTNKKYVKSETVAEPAKVNQRQAAYQRALHIQNIRDRNSMPKFLRESKIPITDYEIYNSAANLRIPELAIFNRIRKWWNPISEGKFRQAGYGVKGASNNKAIKGYLPLPKTKTTTESQNSPVIIPTPNQTPTPSGNVVSTTEQKLLPAPESQKFLPTTIKIKPRSNRGFSSSDQREINNWIESYNLSSSRSKSSPKGGYKGKYKLSSIPEGQFGLRSSNGDKIMFDRDLFGNITITIGDKQKSFKDFSRARQYMSKQLYSLFDTKKINYSEMSNILRSFKQQGILKQGGKIDRQKIQKYKDFINK